MSDSENEWCDEFRLIKQFCYPATHSGDINSYLDVLKNLRGHDGFCHGGGGNLGIMLRFRSTLFGRQYTMLTGAITVALILYLAPSRARVFVNATSPILAAL